MALTATAEPPVDGKPFPPPPRCFGLGQLTRHNVLMLKELNLATIPVVYGDEYYNYVVDHPTFCRLGKLRTTVIPYGLQNELAYRNLHCGTSLYSKVSAEENTWGCYL